MEAAYPDAFVYLVHLPGLGTWAGASPETLLRSSDGEVKTQALAGTRKAGVYSGGVDSWGEKEREEQALVAEYIEEVFWGAGMKDFRKNGPDTIRAGNVHHLSTTFSASLKGRSQLKMLLEGLHPTPAVLGVPKERAWQEVRRIEAFDRQYYAGFLGPVGKKNADLFVNLRCLQLLERAHILYVGGGITTASDPEKEWEETVLKARTLLSVTENL